MHLRLIRHATLRLELGGRQLLVDPMLDPAGARPPVENTENDRRNPLVELPEPAEVVVAGVDAVLVTHLHQDHFDATAAELLPQGRAAALPARGRRRRCASAASPTSARSSASAHSAAITDHRTPARHGCGADAERLAPVSGFLLRADGGRSLYIAGDTVLYEAVEARARRAAARRRRGQRERRALHRRRPDRDGPRRRRRRRPPRPGRARRRRPPRRDQPLRPDPRRPAPAAARRGADRARSACPRTAPPCRSTSRGRWRPRRPA